MLPHYLCCASSLEITVLLSNCDLYSGYSFHSRSGLEVEVRIAVSSASLRLGSGWAQRSGLDLYSGRITPLTSLFLASMLIRVKSVR